MMDHTEQVYTPVVGFSVLEDVQEAFLFDKPR